MHNRHITAFAICVAGFLTSPQSMGIVVTFHSQPDWLTAIHGPAQVTIFHFDGATETQGKFANDPTIVPSYSSQGVDFLPFAGTTVYPVIYRNQGHQIPDPNRDGLLANNSSPNSVSDLDGRTIKFNFNKAINSVGVFTNKANDGDGGYLQAFDGSMNLIGTVNLNPGIFGGLVSDQLIKHVSIVNTFNSDIKFGVWDLQFAAPIPEPEEYMMMLGFGMVGWQVKRKQRKAMPTAA